MVALLDVNLLLALAWPNHVHHEDAHAWFSAERGRGWATCALTQAAFLRLSAQPAVVKMTIALADAMAVLEANVAASEHEFWPLDQGFGDMAKEIRERVVTHRQVTDAVLLALAIGRGGRLATLDRGIQQLLDADSPHRTSLEIVPVG
ncbi:MAG: TA system VapC family ribonuclease toxin [Acidobacteriota bacterium]